ncbi:hypothetical protein [Lentilactobacillus sunkii]|uniref:Uncharacterized protein n=1 Tax=Lentilactobacillus sunkii DSM 19904 TaxID=1423808 RepID=A0A0R1KUP3_9LACO|nr:hypothetical protein [Lentilactobacillus sunkii]KRK87550.1 hypothetical protein FD17_GL000949 [Lentilactobacillus sunkii DSM 19904]
MTYVSSVKRESFNGLLETINHGDARIQLPRHFQKINLYKDDDRWRNSKVYQFNNGLYLQDANADGKMLYDPLIDSYNNYQPNALQIHLSSQHQRYLVEELNIASGRDGSELGRIIADQNIKRKYVTIKNLNRGFIKSIKKHEKNITVIKMYDGSEVRLFTLPSMNGMAHIDDEFWS